MARSKQGAFSTQNKPVSQKRGGLSGVSSSGGQGGPVTTGRRARPIPSAPIRNGSRVRQLFPNNRWPTTNPPASGRAGVSGSPFPLRDSGGRVDQSVGSGMEAGLGFPRRAIRSGKGSVKQKAQLLGQTFRRGRVQNDNVGRKGGIGVEYVGKGGTKRGQ